MYCDPQVYIYERLNIARPKVLTVIALILVERHLKYSGNQPMNFVKEKECMIRLLSHCPT
jgi:hypothetical protein